MILFRSSRYSQPDKRGQRGFVLPYVLAVIAILAIAGTIAASRLQASTRVIMQMQEQTQAELALSSAEAAVTFSLMRANPVPMGFDLNPQSPIRTEFGLMPAQGGAIMRPDEAGAIPSDIWRATSEIRKVLTPHGPVYVSLQDVSGLIHLNKTKTDQIEKLLNVFSLSRRDSKNLANALADYVDPDNITRPFGAEARQYSLEKRAAPTNSPLRNYGELSLVKGWDRVLPRLNMNRLKAATTLQPNSQFRAVFAPDMSAQTLNQRPGEISRRPDDPFSALRSKQVPTSHQRLTFWAPLGQDRFLKRAVEISRRTGGGDAPYRRLWVYETVVLRADLEQKANNLEALANAVFTPSVRR